MQEWKEIYARMKGKMKQIELGGSWLPVYIQSCVLLEEVKWI